ncbi:MAG: hypothetical protein LBR47_00170 [Spirochaetaceae bacterium]|jgi:hypothetical protein|nr:hypothetical protein [Spirochaetaceae bacterium]
MSDSLAIHRLPKNKSAAERGAFALIEYLKKNPNTHNDDTKVIPEGDISVGDWVKRFISIDTNPRTAKNAAKGRLYSPAAMLGYQKYYNNHILDDPFAELKMKDVGEDDVTDYINRLSVKKNYRRISPLMVFPNRKSLHQSCQL